MKYTTKLGDAGFGSDERRLTLTFPIAADRTEATQRWYELTAKMGYEVTWGPTVDEIMLEKFEVWGMVKPHDLRV